MDPTEGAAALDATVDICAQLMRRYAASSAPQHRHLIATAAAMKAILLEDSLPLSPLSYFAAAITALSEPHQNDAASSSAIATLLSIVLPIVLEGSISPEKAREAVGILVRVLEDEKRGSTSSAKCVVKCLGVLLGFCDLGDWDSVELPFETLLRRSLDKRPKVSAPSFGDFGSV